MEHNLERRYSNIEGKRQTFQKKWSFNLVDFD